MPSRPFDESSLPSFDSAPSVILVGGELDFFVEEAAAEVSGALGGSDIERLRFDDDASPEAVSDALLNRSLFSPRRVVELDVTRLLGTEAPAELADAAVEAWNEGTPAGRRKAFRFARALLAALSIERGSDPGETAGAVARKVKRPDQAESLARILAELPEERSSGSLLTSAIRTLLERGANDGVVALLTAIQPPAAGLSAEIGKKGLLLRISVNRKNTGEELSRLALARAHDREVTLESGAIARLLERTGRRPAVFAAELSKLLEWAGKGGSVLAADVGGIVDDEASENLYEFYDVLSRRDAAAALTQLERILSGHTVVMGDKEIDTEEYWPIRFLSLLSGEIRRMLLLRERLDDPAAGYAPGMTPAAFERRVLPRLQEMDRGAERPLASGKPYAVYKLAERAANFRTAELARALARAADVDAQLKNSTPPLAALTAYVGAVIAGE